MNVNYQRTARPLPPLPGAVCSATPTSNLRRDSPSPALSEFGGPRPMPSPGFGAFSQATSSPAAKSPLFGSVKSMSRKKPPGLDISKSIAKTLSPIDAEPTDSINLMTEVARLQISSRSSSSEFASGPESPPSFSPTEPTSAASHASAASTAITAAPLTAASATGSTHSLRLPSRENGATTPSSLSSSTASKKKPNTRKRSTKRDDENIVKASDLEFLADLGAGNGGSVSKVCYTKRQVIMAKKLVLVDAKPAVRKQIVRELQIMNDCRSPQIVEYYGCFPEEPHIGIVMEFMDLGSLDHIYRRTGAIDISIVGKVAQAVLLGLVYLYDNHKIIHRDIKPSNILANSKGQIKICDFGVSSGELDNSVANTFVGTGTYMSPERIQGGPYTIKGDVWSLGITLIELAQGRFPYQDDNSESEMMGEAEDTIIPNATLSQRPPPGINGPMGLSILDLLQFIVNEPSRRLVTTRYITVPQAATVFVDACLKKNPEERKSPKALLDFPWISCSKVSQDDLRIWAEGIAAQLAKK